jgi:hypothetical protein
MKKLIERAKATAVATGATAPYEDASDGLMAGVDHEAGDAILNEIAREIDAVIVADETNEQEMKKAAEARANNLAVAKVLLALDILSEVSR